MQKVCSITPKIIFPFGSKQGVVRYMTIKVKIVVCVVIFWKREDQKQTFCGCDNKLLLKIILPLLNNFRTPWKSSYLSLNSFRTPWLPNHCIRSKTVTCLVNLLHYQTVAKTLSCTSSYSLHEDFWINSTGHCHRLACIMRSAKLTACPTVVTSPSCKSLHSLHKDVWVNSLGHCHHYTLLYTLTWPFKLIQDH